MNRPDFSDYLAHFTKESKPCSDDAKNPALPFAGMSAKDRLISILQAKKISSSIMPWTGASAVCFTECPWSSILAHTQNYSPYGIGFTKQHIYALHGGPAYYIRPDHLIRQEKIGIDKQMLPFLTPFSPSYRPKHMKGKYFPTVDYSHEREWRVPHDFPFEYDQIQFVILKDYKDMAAFPQELKDAIGRDKFILVDNYKQIESLWPVHLH